MQILVVHFRVCLRMSMEGFRHYGGVFRLRFVLIHAYSSFILSENDLTFESHLQLRYGCNSSEDHQFVRGIPIYTISKVLEKIIFGAKGPPLLINGIRRPMPLVRVLEVELYPTLLSKARSFGLNNNWIQVCISPTI